MIHTRTIITSIAALGMLLGTAAFAQTEGTADATATVTGTSTLEITDGGVLTFDMTATNSATDTTTLSFASNDGVTHNITVVAAAGGWVFSPTATGGTTDTYPTLSIKSVVAEGFGVPTTFTDLISSADAVGGAVDVVTGIINTTGTATVTLETTITQPVAAGAYATSVTYSIIAAPTTP